MFSFSLQLFSIENNFSHLENFCPLTELSISLNPDRNSLLLVPFVISQYNQHEVMM